jgi:plastocyanin
MRNKQVGLLMVLLVILAIGSVLLAACARPGTPSASANKGKNSGGGGGGGNMVHMGNTNFLVSTTTIAKGSKLTLVNDAAVPHIIKNGTWAAGAQKLAQEPGAPTVDLTFSTSGESHDIGPFTTAGTFHLLCTIHVDMNLTVSVK